MDPIAEDEGGGRWDRARRSGGGRRWLVPFLAIVVVPILIGAAVVLIAGRGVAFEVLRRITTHKFPDVQSIDRAELTRWREDAGRTQPLVVDARTGPEYRVSHLRDAVRVEAMRPSLRPLKGLRQERSDRGVLLGGLSEREAGALAGGPGLHQRAEPGGRHLPVGQRGSARLPGRPADHRGPPLRPAVGPRCSSPATGPASPTSRPRSRHPEARLRNRRAPARCPPPRPHPRSGSRCPPPASTPRPAAA